MLGWWCYWIGKDLQPRGQGRLGNTRAHCARLEPPGLMPFLATPAHAPELYAQKEEAAFIRGAAGSLQAALRGWWPGSVESSCLGMRRHNNPPPCSHQGCWSPASSPSRAMGVQEVPMRGWRPNGESTCLKCAAMAEAASSRDFYK